ncbi:MAG: hypothetical protein IJ092_03900 [Atopobiaceae bacterium]|nr:hypothetical protein [Atopobiaceae bacterium]
MTEIRIRLIGNVAFENDMKLSEDFRYDVPVDQMGIPYIPIAKLLPAPIVQGRRVGFAFPEGYVDFARYMEELVRTHHDIVPQVSACFTEEKVFPGTGEWMRYLKAGQDFYATVEVGEDWDGLARGLESVKHIGVRMEGISGEVECRLVRGERNATRWEQPTKGLAFDRVEYSVMPITPMCIHAPYEDGPSTITYVPGMVFRDALEKLADDDMKARLRRMVFSNAYIGDESARLLPLPLCMSVVKLDKKQLRYRLSSGKDPNRVEQDVGVGDAYAKSFENMLTVYTKPEIERIASQEDGMVDALSRGQMFRGMIYGSDDDLKAVFSFLKAHQQLTMGSLTQEGFGYVRISVDRLAEAEVREERLARSFDVSCLAHTLILNRLGMQDTTEEGFLGEIERVLNAPGRLRVVGRYLDVYMDYSQNLRWGKDGAVCRCLAKGSVMRLETCDGQPIDISPLLHAFIGERTRDGYGEIMAYPALDCYYRAAEQRSPEKYRLEYPLSLRTTAVLTDLVSRVLELMLQRKIKSLGVLDQGDAQIEAEKEEFMPLELMQAIRDRNDPYISDEKLVQWYREGMEEERDGFLSYQ